MLLRYDFGTADTWSTAPSATYSTVSGSLGHGNIEIVSCEKGIWVCQNYRGTASTADAPGFMFMDHNGNIKFKSSDLTGDEKITESPESGIAISSDMSRLAVVNLSGNLTLYKVTWSGDTPSLTWQYEVDVPNTTDIEQIVFDPADNL